VHLRHLEVDVASHPRGQAHLSSASGLVRAGRWLYVAADDEHHIGMLDAFQPELGAVQMHRILPGDLPAGKKDRKKHKPDMESLALVPPAPHWPEGALLMMGSGSRPNRERGILIALDGEGALHGRPAVIDLAALYEPLHGEFADLNIESAFIADGCFRLLQRANKGADSRNACVDYALEGMLRWLSSPDGEAPRPIGIRPMALPDAAGVPLGFTDAAALPDGGWIFSAVAEDTDDSYSDGECAASVLGWVGADGQVLRIEPIAGAPKVEGIAFDAAGRLLMVTDADDPERASSLLAATASW
jgi:hypothetical protein